MPRSSDARTSWASFPNDASIMRLVGAIMLEHNDEWSLNRRYMQFEAAAILPRNLSQHTCAVSSNVGRAKTDRFATK
ncbi:hypothetical protein SRS16CHR_02167 [Variovorax sp. SRS16]|nr:hypothetical protein SRS16CHR_02167 [Variovorax sp. SRS16]